MLDLPLRGDEKPADQTREIPREPERASEPELPSEPKRPSGPPSPAARPTRPSDRRRRRRRPKRRRWPLFLVLLLILGAAGFAYYRFTTPEASFSVEALEFGEQRVGGSTEPLALTITNRGSRAMHLKAVGFRGEAAGDFQVSADLCSGASPEPGEACTVEVIFQPTANGGRNAMLFLEGNVLGSLPLLGTGAAPVLTADKGEIDFGPQPVDGRSASRTLSLTNEGAAAMSIEAVEVAGDHAADFSTEAPCMQDDLPPGENCTVRIHFTPRAAGERLATLAVDSDGAGRSVVISLKGVGVWSGQPLVATPEVIAFGKQRRGQQSKPQQVAFINRTSLPMEVGSVRLDAGDSGVAIDSQNCEGRGLAAGGECVIALTFTPGKEGASSALVAVTTAEGLETAVELTGTGVEPRLSVEKDELDFGGIRVGFEERSRAVLTNSGTATVHFGDATIAGSQARSYSKTKDGCSDFSLAPGRTCSIEMRFSPTTTGTQRAELRVESDAAGGRKIVSLEGLGTAAEISVSPRRLDFGTVQRPGATDQTLTLRNDGSARMQIQRLSVAGGASGDFVVSRIGCGESGLDAGASCRVSVRFAPRGDGARAARLVIQHDAGAAVDVPLVGTALAARPGFRLSERSLDFGGRPIGSRSPARTLTVTNAGDGRLELRHIAIEGTHAREFSIVPGTCDGAPYVAAKGSCTIGVRFTPGGSGRRQATLRIQHNAGGSATIALSGQGSDG